MEKMNRKPDSNPGELKYTIEKFFRPSGSSTQLKGVSSDIVVPSTTNVVNEYSETTLKYAMPWDTVTGTPIDRALSVQPYLSDLRKRSEARVAKDPDFNILQKVIEEEKRVLSEKTVSLNEQVRLKDKKEQDARLEEVKKALAARPASKEKVYKFTLKQADLPGLPAALDPKKEGKKASTDNADDAADPTSASMASVDTTLEESERILLDLINLSPRFSTASR
jgi:carboxyl-terminal processing protease